MRKYSCHPHHWVPVMLEFAWTRESSRY
jgi:hypothetical protein